MSQLQLLRPLSYFAKQGNKHSDVKLCLKTSSGSHLEKILQKRPPHVTTL